MKVVVVESPAKAKTINKYLGDEYRVLASYGHVRDLPPKDGSVRPDADFAMDWEVDPRSQKRIDEIARALKGAKTLYLATDPDREGEAISWHVRDVLEAKRALNGIDVGRVVFHEVTKNAVLEAVANPRAINTELVDAYLARRALDYLVGFTLSPVLWRKLPGARSAGRVQSVALRLICEREAEIEAFVSQEYWTVDALLSTAAGAPFTARLTHLRGKKLGKFDLPNADTANAAADAVRAAALAVDTVERKQVRRNPPPPFTTSTLQQEAARKLRLGAQRTMRIAQQLYEGIDLDGETVGLISYMRTDSVNLSREAIDGTRRLIDKEFGAPYLPDAPRMFRSTAKNAQEAHEAIRPTDLFRRPQDVARFLDEDSRRLYELIWKRTVACQMASAVLDQVTVDVAPADRSVQLRATGSVLVFDGFLKLYSEGRDDPADDDDEGRMLPAMNKGEALATRGVKPEQHFTEPPPRYTEASLVKKMEELGIGRPSTYASIIQVLQDRDYVRLDQRRFIPEDRGRLVTAFLDNFFERYVQYNFTADLEQKLDDVSNGRLDWRALLREFWTAFHAKIDGTKDLTISQVIDKLDDELGRHFFPDRGDGHDPRGCPACKSGRLGLRLGRNGAFIGCSNYPECRFTRPLAMPSKDGEAATDVIDGPKLLGTDPVTGEPVTLRKGPYGHYVQLGEAPPPAPKEAVKEKGKAKAKKAEAVPKPKRASLPRGTTPDSITLASALALLSLPREVGTHPEDGQPILAGLGRFGPYLKHGTLYKSLGRDDDVLTIGINRAVTLLAEAKARPGATPLRELGAHPSDGVPVTLHSGRYGPYAKHGKVMASLPKGADPETVTIEAVVPLLAAKAGAAPAAKGRGKAAPKTVKAVAPADTETKPAAKKTTAKKTASKKAAGAKTAAAKSTTAKSGTAKAPAKRKTAGD